MTVVRATGVWVGFSSDGEGKETPITLLFIPDRRELAVIAQRPSAASENARDDGR
jgi:hypothetical protein